MHRTAGAVLAAALVLSTSACAGGSAEPASSEGSSIKTLSIMAPAAPGGGWDSTSRAAQGALERGGIVKRVEVTNVAGAGGTIGLAKLAGLKGQGDQLMTMGLVMVGAVKTNKSAATLDDVTPIARLTSEQEAVVVPADSPLKTLDDLVQAWKADPGKVSVAGGSAGGTDQILAGLLAQAAGVDPKKVNYVAFSGGGEALAAILGGKVTIGISGVSEFTDQIQAGKLRALAVSGDERVEGLDAPTASEAGLDVVLENWRGMVAPAGISDADAAKLEKAVEQMHGSQAWKDEMAKNGWDDAYQGSDEFSTFLDSEQTRIEGVLTDLGLV